MWADEKEVLLGTLSDEPTIEELSSVSVKAPADGFFYLFYLFFYLPFELEQDLEKKNKKKTAS